MLLWRLIDFLKCILFGGCPLWCDTFPTEAENDEESER